uniref:Uncharacterized protein n=1 Tax=Anguilla anguilla TaxID=7936 RepID=A0A0E9PW84_ANGAN
MLHSKDMCSDKLWEYKNYLFMPLGFLWVYEHKVLIY